jgi:hypothetical protein
MKHIVTLFASVLLSAQILGQASAVVFSEVGEKFTIYLNGEKQNSTPQSNVKITGLTSEFYQARVDFEDSTLPDFAEGNFAVQRGFEFTYVIKKNKKAEYVMRYYGQTESDGAAAPASAPQSDVKRVAEVDDTPAPAPVENFNINQSIQVQEEPVGGKTTVTQTTTTTTKKQPTAATAAPTGGNVSMGINVDGVNMGISINATDMGGAIDMNVSEETVITTTTTTTTSSTAPAPAQPAAPAAKPAAPRPAPQPVAPPQPVGRCAASMSAPSFSKAKDNISSNSFEDSKMTIAKQVTKANCMTAEQIKDVMGLFSFEDSKLDYAKYAYDFCFNQGDYYEVNEAFTFESSIEELNQYLESK